MPPSFSTTYAWLGRQHEKLVDAALLLVALNVPTVFSIFAPTPWPAQVTILALFAALVPPRAHLIPALWRRYLRFLSGYAIVALAGVVIFIYWFNLPRNHAWFAPLWLVLTALARLPVIGPARQAVVLFRTRRLDIICTDSAWVAGFSYGVPRWTGHAGPNPLTLAFLLLAWLVWHCVRGGCDPAQSHRYRRGSWTVLGLAFAWAVLWSPETAAWPTFIFAFWLGLALALTRMAAGAFAASPGSGLVEVFRWIGLFAISAVVFHPFVRATLHGGGDSHYYATFLADALTQFRHDVFPVFVGQSEYQFNGPVIPIRIAPGFQYLGGLLDLLTGRVLGVIAVQNLLITLTAFAASGSAYVCLRRLQVPGYVAWMLSFLFLTCPGVAGLAFNTDLYLSWLTAPWVPVVLFLSLRSFSTENVRHFAALGFILGFTWWLHTPIALWLTLVASGFQLARLVWARPAWRVLGAQLAPAAAAFLLAAMYPLVSATLYPADPAIGSGGRLAMGADLINLRLQDNFPAAWLPLSHFGRQLGDFQIGYGLLVVGGLAIPFIWRAHRIELTVLVFTVSALLVLLLPIPHLNLALWQLMPAAIRLVTGAWAMQRLYIVLAATLIFLAGASWSFCRPPSRLGWLLLAACLWSATEVGKFVAGSRAATKPDENAVVPMLPENVTLTRYSYGLFGTLPAYFTHGTTDPVLENRFLADDLHTVVGGNQEAAIKMARTTVRTEHHFIRGVNQLVTQRPLILTAGKRYLLELVASSDPFPTATLLLRGGTIDRIYGLPQYGEALSFGLGGKHTPFMPLSTTSSREESVAVQLIPAESAMVTGLEDRVFLLLSEYDPAALPVQIRSWLPYTASVQSAGATWLETPRMFQAGYRALVDRQPVEVRRSQEGLVSLPVPAGSSQVELRYAAPFGLLASFWLSFSTIALGWTFLGMEGWRLLKGSTRAAATQAAIAP